MNNSNLFYAIVIILLFMAGFLKGWWG